MSRPAKLVILALGIGILLLAQRFLYPFLAVNQPVKSEFLVVEGWAPPNCLKQAASLCKARNYRIIFTSGGRALNEWGVPPDTTYAQLAAGRLYDLGMTNGSVQAVPCSDDQRDRTYHSALAIKEWCEKNQIRLNSLNLLTLGPHARRSRLLYQKAFGKEVGIGVFSFDDPNYDARHWWRSSEGFRDTIGETIAFFYARVLFHPSNPASPAKSEQ